MGSGGGKQGGIFASTAGYRIVKFTLSQNDSQGVQVLIFNWCTPILGVSSHMYHSYR